MNSRFVRIIIVEELTAGKSVITCASAVEMENKPIQMEH